MCEEGEEEIEVFGFPDMEEKEEKLLSDFASIAHICPVDKHML